MCGEREGWSGREETGLTSSLEGGRYIPCHPLLCASLGVRGAHRVQSQLLRCFAPPFASLTTLDGHSLAGQTLANHRCRAFVPRTSKGTNACCFAIERRLATSWGRSPSIRRCSPLFHERLSARWRAVCCWSGGRCSLEVCSATARLRRPAAEGRPQGMSRRDKRCSYGGAQGDHMTVRVDPLLCPAAPAAVLAVDVVRPHCIDG